MAFVAKIKRHVTLPVHKMRNGITRYFKFLEPMYTGKQVSDTMSPAEVCKAVDLETGELGLVILPTVMRKELVENYPNHGYVNKCFQVRQTMVQKMQADGTPGKKYNVPSIAEIEEPEDVPEPSDAAAQAQARAHAQEQEQAAEGDDSSDSEEASEVPAARPPAARRRR